MKKPSLSLNPAALTGFFVGHGEKLVLALVGVLSLVMIWWGIDAVRSQAAGEARSPRAVSSLADQASRNIEKESKVPDDRLPDRRPLTTLLDPWRPQQVKIADPPAGRSLLTRPLFAELTKRTKPDVFPIEDLRAVAGIAVLPDAQRGREAGVRPPPQPDGGAAEAARGRDRRGRGRSGDRDEGGDGSLFGIQGGGSLEAPPAPTAKPIQPGKITPFVVVTGLIPAARQQAEYDRRFAATSYRDPQRDRPRWAVYLVERARIVPGGSPRWEKLKESNPIPRQSDDRIDMGEMPRGEQQPVERETLPPEAFLDAEESEVDYAPALPQRIDDHWGAVGVHPWFAKGMEEFLKESAANDSQPRAGEVPLVTLAELVRDARNFEGKEFSVEEVTIDPDPRQQGTGGLYKFGVRSTKPAVVVATGDIGSTRNPVFAISEQWGKELTLDGTIGKPQTCNLRCRVEMIGKTPVVRILEFVILRQDGTVETRNEPELKVNDRVNEADFKELKFFTERFVDGTFWVRKIWLHGSPDRIPNVKIFSYMVSSKDNEMVMSTINLGRNDELAFVASSKLGEDLLFQLGSNEKVRCDLKVQVKKWRNGYVAQIVEVKSEIGVNAIDRDPKALDNQLAGQSEDTGDRKPQGADNRLFRFVDTKVKPGETYRYRVKFALRNPNLGLAPRHLVDPAAAKGEFLISEYSSETPPVRVPDPTVVLARTIDRDTARKMKLRDALEVMVLAPSAKTGNFALRSTITEVGGLANVDMGLNRSGDTRFFGESVETDRILIDVRGSQEDRKDIRSSEPPEPLEMLILEPDGSFEIVSAADSERQVRRYGQTLFRPNTQLPDDGRPDRSDRSERDAEPPPRGLR